MDYKKLYFRAKQFGGTRLAKAYMKMGLGPMVCSNVLLMLLRIETRNEAYASISRKSNKILQKKYKKFLLERKSFYDGFQLEQKKSTYIWSCWLQGFDKAPKLVKVCVESMKTNFPDRKIVLLSLDNYKEYVELPSDIVKKYKDGQIPPALFSDLLRLELLIKYGGTWMDATILCTKGGAICPNDVMDCDLFVFQSIVNKDDKLRGISNWFITACSNNRILMVLRDVLIQYWRDYDCCLDYYIFHDFFISISRLYPNEISVMPKMNRLIPLQLMDRMGDKYDEKWMNGLKTQTCFHKLNYRLSDKVLNDSSNFYHAIINGLV